MSQSHKSNTVQFSHSMPVTNASCCSDENVMCPKCAMQAIALASHGDDKHIPLGQPVWNWQQEEPQHAEQAQSVKNTSGQIPLGQPVWEW